MPYPELSHPLTILLLVAHLVPSSPLAWAGASLINTGIGWHEARIPTIATSVPRGGFAWVTQKLRGSVTVPLVATNRINTPEIAETILGDGQADLVSMARPFLADPFFLSKASAGEAERINTCIACNQACLDHSFHALRAPSAHLRGPSLTFAHLL